VRIDRAHCLGGGVEHVHRTLEQFAGRAALPLTAAEISAAAMCKDAGARAALTMFCSIFGAAAGDLALAHAARGGIYIAGGISRGDRRFPATEPRFAVPSRPIDCLRRGNPTKLIIWPDIALLGAARTGTRSHRRHESRGPCRGPVPGAECAAGPCHESVDGSASIRY
jgi:glucokinase